MKISGLMILFSFLVLTVFTSAQTKDHPGKKVFMDSKCQTCHTVESQQITSKGKKTTDLSNVGAVYRANFLEKFLTKKEKLNDKNHPQAFKGSNEELNQLAEWLQTLNTGEGNKDSKGDKSDIKGTGKDTTGTKK
jgi:cytochrome c553